VKGLKVIGLNVLGQKAIDPIIQVSINWFGRRCGSHWLETCWLNSRETW
jgi:hypothetical protein